MISLQSATVIKKKIYVQSAMLSWKSHKASDTWSCKATKWDYIETQSCTCFVLIKYKRQQQQEAGRRRKRSLEQKTRSKILQEQQKDKKEKLVSNDL